jgi:LuxR family transcriptional regulator, maltose regulon positive regulatory protein
VARQISYVADGVLHVLEPSGEPKIAVGSPSWIAWLTNPATRSFAFRSSSATYTARKERRSRGGEYWTAYRRHSGRLRKAYLGKAEDLTLDRLDDAAAMLARSDERTTANPPPHPIAGDAGVTRADAAATEDPTTAEDHVQERSHQGAHGDQLLLTKLSVPSARPSLVPRPRLRERLEEGLGCTLTLVSAPAGFGKTTLLSAWTSDLTSRRPIAWLSLDAADNDPARFWRYFVTAVDRLHPGSGETALALLGSPQAPPIEAVLTTLLNELAYLEADAVLVLDDYHLIESRAIHEALTFLIEHLPPRLHLVIATRADPPLPLSRLRARDALNEVRAADLRFSPGEAATFLNQVMGLQLSAEDIAELEGRTEGWIAGLQMAALAMRDHDDVPSFIASFMGSNRHVVDYLAEEVLGRQPEELRTFLLETSILDRMCAPLCNAVTGHTDGQTTLERLEHANLFVIPLDDERRWYRYHHLFADVLRQRLHRAHANLVPSLHKRASGWFEGEGLVVEAIHHALAAQDWERAVRLIEASGIAVVLSQQVQTVLGWIDEIPEELVRKRPALCTIHALALMLSNRPDAAEARLREAERCVRGTPTTDEARTILGQIAVIRAAIARSSGDLERCAAMGRKALELLPETEATARERAAAMMNAALAYQVSGNVTPANERPLEEASAAVRASGALIVLLLSITFLARLRTLQGRLRAAAATYEEAATVVSGRNRLRDLVNSAAYYVGLGDIHREWNDLDAAERYLRRGMHLFTGALMVDADVVTHGCLSLARVQQARGRGADARATLDDFVNLARQRDFFPLLVARGEAARARLALMQDDLPTAIKWTEASGLDANDEPSYPREEEYLTLVRVLIAQGRLDPMSSYLDDALGILDRLFRTAEGGARMWSVIEILALRALALQAQHDSSEALAALERALALAQPEGYVRLFVDEGAPMAALLSELLKRRRKGPRDARQHAMLGYVRRLLAVFESPHTSTDPPVPGGYARGQDQPLPEHLTAREREVLELIAAGLSNQEIAAQLFIATSTVKGYVHSIFRKLEVDSRTKAVARARELGFVSE